MKVHTRPGRVRFQMERTAGWLRCRRDPWMAAVIPREERQVEWRIPGEDLTTAGWSDRDPAATREKCEKPALRVR